MLDKQTRKVEQGWLSLLFKWGIEILTRLNHYLRTTKLVNEDASPNPNPIFRPRPFKNSNFHLSPAFLFKCIRENAEDQHKQSLDLRRGEFKEWEDSGSKGALQGTRGGNGAESSNGRGGFVRLERRLHPRLRVPTQHKAEGSRQVATERAI